jgi:hypothetical protein
MVEDRFGVFGPKALASINPLDPTTTQRAIVVGMRPALRSIPSFDAKAEEWSALNRDLRYWALDNAAEIHKHYRRWTDTIRVSRAPELFNRAWELAAHLVVLADYIGGDGMSDPIIEWMNGYFSEQRKSMDSADLQRVFVLSLPSLMRNNVPHDEWYYPLKSILDNMLAYLDDDVIDRIKTSTISRRLAPPLGLKNIRAKRGGKQLQVIEEDVRRIFTERRITPNDEDVAWLERKVDYQTEDKIAKPEETLKLTWGNADDY